MKFSEIDFNSVPKDFVWGVATSSFQIEGGVASGGRGRCIWDDMCDTPGKISDKTTDCIGVDHINRWESDVELMKWMELDSYRFSISWPRVQPGGSGAFNEVGIAFYDNLIDGLLARGIEPNITLFHWDLPSELQAIGGWSNPEVVDLFALYAGEMAKRFGHKVTLWATLNEPWCTAFLGHLTGEHAPGIQDFPTSVKVAHQLVRAHALASKAIKENAPGAKVGVVLNLADQRVVGEVTPALQKDMELIDSYQNLWWLQGMFEGKYPQNLLDNFKELTGISIDASEIPDVSYGRDWLGINYYSGQVFRTGDKGISVYPGTTGIDGAPWGDELTDLNWIWTPDGLTKLLVRLNLLFKDMPMYITENGACYNTEIGMDGTISDVKRQEYMAQHINAALESIRQGVNLKGYYAWSFLDNFEWAWGFSMRFGIVHVDFDTMVRTVKESGHQYRKMISERK